MGSPVRRMGARGPPTAPDGGANSNNLKFGLEQDLPMGERAAIARTVAVGVVKYADLQVAHDSATPSTSIEWSPWSARPVLTCNTPRRG
jgi:hypothetical protein